MAVDPEEEPKPPVQMAPPAEVDWIGLTSPSETVAIYQLAARWAEVAGPRNSVVFHLRLSGGAPHWIEVHGDGGTDLDAYLVDSEDHVVELDDRPGDVCVLAVSTAKETDWRMFVVNRGYASNQFEMTIDR